jgi:hypothetical protein
MISNEQVPCAHSLEYIRYEFWPMSEQQVSSRRVHTGADTAIKIEFFTLLVCASHKSETLIYTTSINLTH